MVQNTAQHMRDSFSTEDTAYLKMAFGALYEAWASSEKFTPEEVREIMTKIQAIVAPIDADLSKLVSEILLTEKWREPDNCEEIILVAIRIRGMMGIDKQGRAK